MERFIAQKIITGGVKLEIRGPTGPSCTRHPLKRLNQTGRGGRGRGGGRKVEKAWKDRDRRREMKEGVSPQFPWEHFPRSQLTRGSFAKVTSLRASSSLFRVTSDGPRENALASPFACRSRVTSHGISPTACSQARWYPVRTTPFFAESRFFMVKICFNIACYIGIWNMWF